MTYNWRDISKDFTVEIEINEDFREKIVEIRRLALRCPPRFTLNFAPRPRASTFWTTSFAVSGWSLWRKCCSTKNGGRCWGSWEKVVWIFLKKKKSFLSNDGWRRKETLWRTYGRCRRGWSKEHVYFWDIVLVLLTASVQASSSVFNIKNYYKFNVI